MYVLFSSNYQCCWRSWPGFRQSERKKKKKKKKMGFKKIDRVPVVILLLLLIVFLVCAAGGRELAGEKTQQDHYNAEGTEAPGDHLRNLMVRTNDYGRYDPTPAFSKPRFKPIPH